MVSNRKRSIRTWFFDLNQPKALADNDNNISNSPVTWFTLRKIRDFVTTYNAYHSYFFFGLFSIMKTLEPNIYIRLLFILIESAPHTKINVNVLGHMETMVRKLDVSAPDVFIEILAFLVRNNRINDATTLFDNRTRYMSMKFHRQLPHVDVSIAYYQFYIKYLDWKTSLKENTLTNDCDLSTAAAMQNFICTLEKERGNHEFFIMCLVEMLTYYDQTTEAYNVIKNFQKVNPKNLSANLLLYRFISQYKLHDLDDHQKLIESLREIDASRPEIIEIQELCGQDCTRLFSDLMSSLEYISNRKNPKLWKLLYRNLNFIVNLAEERIKFAVKRIWISHFKLFWSDTSHPKSGDVGSLSKYKRKVSRLLKILEEID